MRKILFIIFIFLFGFLYVQESYALPTYVGLRIVNLTDDPSYSCANEAGYGPPGRIRALSSVLPDFPISFNLTRVSDGAVIWSGNDTKDCFDDGSGCDYTIGDVIFLPELVNLDSGQNYNLFMDIDAIRIYLPLASVGSFIRTSDNNYWTVGAIGSGSGSEYAPYSSTNGCSLSSTYGVSQSSLFYVANQRDPSKLIHNCMTDNSNYNCDPQGIMGIIQGGINSYRIYNQYNNLHLSTVGNFMFGFAMP